MLCIIKLLKLLTELIYGKIKTIQSFYSSWSAIVKVLDKMAVLFQNVHEKRFIRKKKRAKFELIFFLNILPKEISDCNLKNNQIF